MSTRQMNADREVEIRLQVAEGHWELGEREEALASLDLAAKVQPESRALRLFVERVRGEVGEGPLAFYLDALRALLVEASTETVPDAAIFQSGESLPAGALAFDAEPLEAEPLEAETLEPEPLEAAPLEGELLEGELLLDVEDPGTDPGLSFPEFEAAPPEPLPSTPTVAELLAEQGHTDKALAVTNDVLRRNPGDERALAVRERLVAGEHRRSPEVVRILERWLENAVRAGRRPQERRVER